MLSSKDIIPIAIFIAVVYLINKFIISTKKEPESVENGGGLVALTDTSKLLVTDDSGNLSTYTPATDGFKTNNLNVTGTMSASTINGTGTSTFTGAVNLDGGVTCKSTSMINANGGIKGTTADFNGNINAGGGLTGTTVNVTGDIKTSSHLLFERTDANNKYHGYKMFHGNGGGGLSNNSLEVWEYDNTVPANNIQRRFIIESGGNVHVDKTVSVGTSLSVGGATLTGAEITSLKNLIQNAIKVNDQVALFNPYSAKVLGVNGNHAVIASTGTAKANDANNYENFKIQRSING